MTKKSKEKPGKAIKQEDHKPDDQQVKNTLDFDKAMEIIVNVQVDKKKDKKNKP